MAELLKEISKAYSEKSAYDLSKTFLSEALELVERYDLAYSDPKAVVHLSMQICWWKSPKWSPSFKTTKQLRTT